MSRDARAGQALIAVCFLNERVEIRGGAAQKIVLPLF